MKILRCNHCGNIATLIDDKGVPLVCCGEAMEELKANTTDAATEKHVPVVEVADNKVKVDVGSVTHPMSEEHLIQWILLETDKGCQIKKLSASDEPKAVFCLGEDKPLAVYEYCNLHGLWKTDIEA